jgi:hypothetical protein
MMARHDWQMTPIDFVISKSKVKVKLTRNDKTILWIITRTLWHRIMKVHREVHHWQMTRIDFAFSRSKIKVIVTENA